MDVRRLDIFEGDQYTRRKVKVQVLKDVGLDEAAHLDSDSDAQQGELAEEVEAETYIWTSPPSELESKEWDFEVFKRDKMKAWMGMAESGPEEGVDVDEGFADVDRAVAEEQEQEREEKERGLNGKAGGDGGGRAHDPTGGRGTNGFITRQLEEAAV